MTDMTLSERAELVRQFNRFYTRQIDRLNQHLLSSEFSLTEVRVMHELLMHPQLTTSAICRQLSLNIGYLSRVISGLENQLLITKTRSTEDARVMRLQLTDKGLTRIELLNALAQQQLMAVLEPLSATQQQQLTNAMNQIEALLGNPAPGYILRDPLPGDLGLVVHQNAVLYTTEYGWSSEFEAMAAEIVAKYLREFVPGKERCWIAEKGGKLVGSVFVVRKDDDTAWLRLLYVDASARGLGIGHRLVEEALTFARHAGYKKMELWTNSILVAAAKIYQQTGFRLTAEEAHHSFGKDLVGQVWIRDL
ncbi:helix-turn-helix domain-containing GNAT family N-acetyltransferase [Erwiniaceae bacterium BAC15a-03b]|uniref:Helix-turn-helix domain-containing GNAT family N-acetyltransferase n=1 Tax=Winslowiella arboricola TaxID=2978220 RepID=A0A9J6Q141_9GAMM|nr:helix-turn-helix domain-containing GNAT family N-acetyltransferase [Winslowiella arboricola]MCU5774889.1 helix-turn-helix domain-containing GNAT family N-acetyltransferase [Winslowiella arboricola]MCU5779959.1 helix-turn-helix domain-containing GNAT family N-acetyltransferase [Winslowiella arboricola]